MTQDNESARWFAEQVQPHEPMPRAWLASQFPQGGCDIADIVQEAFVRIMRTHASTPGRSPGVLISLLLLVRHRGVETPASSPKSTAQHL